MEDLDWYISQAGDDIHLIEKFEAEDSYDLYEALELDELATPGAPPVVKGSKKLDVSLFDLMVDAVLAHSLGVRDTWWAVLRCCRMLPEAHVLFILLGLIRDGSAPPKSFRPCMFWHRTGCCGARECLPLPR